MTGISGWTNTFKLALKNVSYLGDGLETALARLNPDAAAELGREQRQADLATVAKAKAKLSAETEPVRRDLEKLKSQLAEEKAMAAKAVEKARTPGAAALSPASMQSLIDSIKRIGADVELKTAIVSRNTQGIEFLQTVIDQRIEALRSYDAEANQAKHDLQMAELQKQQAAFEQELHGYATHSSSTAGIGALKRAAMNAQAEAAAAQTVATASAPARDSSELAALRKEVQGGGVSALDELEKLSK